MVKKTHHVMPDIKPYKSMLTGEVISSRSKHREHLKAHGCIEVGNELGSAKPRERDVAPEKRHEIIRTMVNQHTDSTWRKMMRREVQMRNDNPRRYYDDGKE